MKAKFINESLSNNIVAYHMTFDSLDDLDDRPIWLAPTLELGMAYYKMMLEDTGDAPHLFEVSISGNFLEEEEIEELCDNMEIDYFDLNNDLVGNPPKDEALNLIQPFRDKCDGFEMSDYDPRDSQSDVMSLCVINPIKVIKNIKMIK